MWSSACLEQEKGMRADRKVQRWHLAVSSDAKMRAERLGFQILTRTHAPSAHETGQGPLWTAKEPSEKSNKPITTSDWKCFIQDLLATFIQTRKVYFPHKHMHFNKLKTADFIEAPGETVENPNKHLSEDVCKGPTLPSFHKPSTQLEVSLFFSFFFFCPGIYSLSSRI